MKKYLLAFAALSLLMACTPDNNNGDKQDSKDELIVTGDVLEVTEYSAKLSGYANLPFELGNAEFGILFGKEQSFEDGKKIVAKLLDENNMFTLVVTGLSHGTTYYYKSYVQNGAVVKYGSVKSFTTKAAPVFQSVDMGTVVKGKNVKWATTNIGAGKAEDYGDYYAWGETAPKADYSWPTYKWCNGRYSAITKYNSDDYYGNIDGITVLQRGEKSDETVDDVARAKLGGKWRMPTDADWTALKEKCTCTWTKQGGVDGLLVESPNGNSIFLPAAGYRVGTELESVACYWSSSLDTDNPISAKNVGFDSGGVYWDDTSYRCLGMSVRPVTE